MPLVPGTTIEGRYTLVEKIGEGGMGEVWRARDLDLRDVALKFVRQELLRDPGLSERFEGEINLVLKFRSAHAVRALTFGRHPTFGPFLVMDLLEGESLRDVLTKSGRIEAVSKAVDYVVQVCDALADAHALGVVHRDLKPENLFLVTSPPRDAGRIMVLDFGIARAGAELRSANLTHQGSFVGTCNYASPEQLRDSTNVTGRSDIWSVGAVLYELLSAQQAFPGKELEPLEAIFRAETRALRELRPGLPEGLVRCVLRCLARDPEARFPDVESLIRELAPFGGNSSRAIALVRSSTHAPSEQPSVGPGATEVLSRPLPAPRDAGAARRARGRGDAEVFPGDDELVQAVLNSTDAHGDKRSVVFMLGAGVSIPAVPGTDEFVRLIEGELPPVERPAVEILRQSHSKNLYQDAFRLLRETGSPYVANTVVRKAVLGAYKRTVQLSGGEGQQSKLCAECERDYRAWDLPVSVDHLGWIIATGLASPGPDGPKPGKGDPRFSELHLTTNFDPLLEISIRAKGGGVAATALTGDGELPSPDAHGQSCVLVHLHGQWTRGDTLHVDLDTRRPRLESSLRERLHKSVLVVLGYGGWDDVFMRTLKNAASGNHDFDVLWAFHDSDALRVEEQYGELIVDLRQALGSRIRFYSGIVASRFLMKLRKKVLLERSERPPPESVSTPQPPGPIITQPDSPAARPWRRWAATAGIGLAVGAIAIGLWLRSEGDSAQAGAGGGSTGPVAGSGGSPASDRREIRIDCASKVTGATGTVKVGPERSLSIEELCRLAHLELAEDAPLLARPAESTLDPFYTFRRKGSELVLEVKEQVELALTFEGQCDKVASVSLSWEGSAVVSHQYATPEAACEKATFTLPRSALGKSLNLVLKPAAYKAPAVTFDAQAKVVRVTRKNVRPVVSVVPTPATGGATSVDACAGCPCARGCPPAGETRARCLRDNCSGCPKCR